MGADRIGRPAENGAVVSEYVRRLQRDAVARRSVPIELAAHAAGVAESRFSCAAAALDRRELRRVEDYFWGVVRRGAFTTHRSAASRWRTRLLVASAIEDLRDGGRSPQGIYDEVAAHYASALGARVLEEIRSELLGGSAEERRGEHTAALAV
jgi:hypothetical protein